MKIFYAKAASPQSAGGIARTEALPAGKREEIASQGGVAKNKGA